MILLRWRTESDTRGAWVPYHSDSIHYLHEFRNKS